MKSRLRAAFSREGRLARLGPSLVLALGLFAYRPLFLNALGLPTRHEVERWFFMPDQKAALLVIGVAGWLLWRRHARLLSLPDRSHRLTTVVLVTIGMSLFLWAQLTATADLLIPSLVSNLLAFASATKGRAGCRAVLVPALVLLFAAPIPVPIRSELVWQLQLWTAKGTAWLMRTTGSDVVLGGVLIQIGEHSFTVIESCSGLRGMEILTLVAVVVRDLFAASGRRQWLLVLVAPWLGFAINVVRVAVVVATSADPQVPGAAAEDHTPQGLAVLLAGTGVLYALGRWMTVAGSRGGDGQAPRSPRLNRGTPGLRLRAATACCVALGTVSVTVTPFPKAPMPGRSPIQIPENRSGWRGEDLSTDWVFVGFLPQEQVLHRRYEKQRQNRPPEVVELFVGFEVAGDTPSSRLFTSKIALPGRDWSLDETRRARIWGLGLDAELAFASRDSQYALVYTWRVRDEGIWRETSRSLLGLESSPFRRERRRAVVRLVTPLPHDEPLVRDRGKQTLDRFITDFRYELARL